MIARLARLALFALLAAVATLVQLDQQTTRSPELAFLVPRYFSANAARARAQFALRTGGGGLADARHALIMRPMPAESLTLFSLTAMGANDAETALAALEAASTRGWREPISQLASGEAAMQQGEYAIAAQRVVALLSTGDLAQPALDLLARLLATPAGREAFAYRLAQPGHWQGNSLPAMVAAVEPADLADTLAQAQRMGADLPCDRLAQLARAYRQRHEDGLLASFWPGSCPQG
ncbi:MAG: hypothetical protein KDE15_06315 [Erythrobacter sp.]|nr:hypothetical protein [Erythrobacter sp.]